MLPAAGRGKEEPPIAKISETPPLRGIRRDMTREDFERLCRLQCRVPQFLGFAGVSRDKLERWCRRAYHLDLEETVEMIRQDGLIEIREAAFQLMKKSATMANQQFNRFLPGAEPDDNAQRDEAIRAFTAMLRGPEEDAEKEALS